MGEHQVDTEITKEKRAQFIRHLLSDIAALEQMLQTGLIEDDITRIGAEQEFCLVTPNWRPANNAEALLAAINDEHFTTELARYNLEINLDPAELTGNCFSRVEHQLNTLLNLARNKATEHDTNLVLTGILPTISKTELAFDYMTPNPRYWALNNMLKDLRGSDFSLHIKGVDELTVTHDSVLFEACNTSFQMHLQIAPDDFVPSYNWSQAISGPLLGISTNSPLLLGRELWAETRIALFQQSIDTRNSSYALKDQQARVTFGDSWAEGTVADIFRNDISRYKVILAKEIEHNSLTQLEQGHIPKLQALNLHNGTIYRWNRPCYGVGGGKPHLRIENRYIPSGPSTVDEMATLALWVGVMMGRPASCNDMNSQMDFRDAKSNFFKAARTGMESLMHWNGSMLPVTELVKKELLPLGYNGLKQCKVDEADIERLLGLVDSRCTGKTGSQWSVTAYRNLRKTMRKDDSLRLLTKAMHDNGHLPMHQWPEEIPAEPSRAAASSVGHIMSTQLFTVNQNDLAELATNIMQWKDIHHVPVEDDHGNLCGLLTWTHMTHFTENSGSHSDAVVSDIMVSDVITATTDASISEAINLMKENNIGCLPVVQDSQLVGIVTIKDMIAYG